MNHARRKPSLKAALPSRSGRTARTLCGLAVCTALFLAALSGCDDVGQAERMQRAQAFLERGRANGAVVELKELLQRDPRDAQARLLLAKAYFMLNQLDSAEKELGRAKELGGDAAAAELQLARVWARQGAKAKIARRLQIRDDWPADSRSEALAIRGNAELALGELEAAATSFEQAVRLRPANVDGLIGLTRIALKSGDKQQLATALEKGLALAPDQPFFQGVQSGRAFADGRYEAAVSGFRKQVRAAPDNVVARLGLAQALMAAGQDDEARGELERVLQTAPRHPSAHYLKAILDLKDRDYEAARRHGLLALAMRPDHEPSMLIAGIANYALGRWRDARWHLDTLWDRGVYREVVGPLREEMKSRLARQREEKTAETGARGLDQDLALFRLSLADLTKAPVASGTAAEIARLLRRGAEALRQGRTSEAVALLDRAYAVAPERRVLLALALAYRRSGAVDLSREFVELWLQNHAEDDEMRLALADLYIFDGELERALPHLKLLVAARPDDVIALNNLSWVLLQRGDASQALGFAERAAALAPGDPRVLDTVGLAYLKLGDAGQAIPVLRQAAHSSITGPVAKLHLAEALYRNGEDDDAKSVLRELMATERARPLHRAAQNLLRQIDG